MASQDDIKSHRGIEPNHEQGLADTSSSEKSQYESKDGTKIEPVVVGDGDLIGYDAAQDMQEAEEANEASKTRRYWRTVAGQNNVYLHVVIWVVFTGWWIAGLVLHRYDLGWLIPFLVWLGITIRLVTFHVSTRYVTEPVFWLWKNSVRRVVQMIPEKFRLPLGAIGTLGVILLGTFINEETADNTRANRAVSIFGLLVFIFIFWATSKDRSKINWHTVIVGMLTQFIIGIFVLRTQAGYDIFNFIAFLAKSLLGYSSDGTNFLFSATSVEQLGWFVLTVLPPIIFFVAFVQLLYYWGWLQFFIQKFATIFFWMMRVSGAEAVVAAASPFVGQGESAMLIKPFIPHLTTSELHAVMTSGFATIAGSVLSAYISFGISPLALISSCVMSIPASLAMSKLRWPETEEPLTADRIIIPESEEEKPANALHAFANGGWLGLKIAGQIFAGLLVVLSLLGLINGLLTWWGSYLSISNPDLTIQLVLGYLLYPLAFLLGVQRNGDLLKVAQILGTKIVANEFVAFLALTGDASYADLSPRSRLIATYAVCGFGNISSLGIQIGILSQLAPTRAGRIAKVAFSALCTGIIATCTSASIAGMLISDGTAYTKFTPATN